jgi:hypothetical protein
MTEIVDATFDGQVFRPSKQVALKADTKVRLVYTTPEPDQPDGPSFLEVARGLNLTGPADWSTRLDDYLYGGADDRGE